MVVKIFQIFLGNVLTLCFPFFRLANILFKRLKFEKRAKVFRFHTNNSKHLNITRVVYSSFTSYFTFIRDIIWQQPKIDKNQNYFLQFFDKFSEIIFEQFNSVNFGFRFFFRLLVFALRNTPYRNE